MRRKKRRPSPGMPGSLLLLGSAGVLAVFLLLAGARLLNRGPAAQGVQASPPSAPLSGSAIPTGADDCRAVWISYLEYEGMDFSSAEVLRAQVSDMMRNCAELGLDRVLVQVRPFGDALYASALFPWSHLITGTQGQNPGYDPFSIFVEEAHAHGLAIEAWVNPYRIQLTAAKPAALSGDNPAVVHPEWALSNGGGLFYDPSQPQVRQLITDGVMELVRGYDIDGVHFDDYFYPYPLEEPFDAAAAPAGVDLAQWRRDNVDALIRQVYGAIKAEKPDVSFGVSPQGNNQNNYDQQYSDVGMWMSTPGYLDYVMPQIYWGFGYLTSSGREDYQFERLVRQWASMPRAQGVKLYIGLGAYRLGAGDGGSNDQAEWTSGHNLADMVRCSREAGADGFCLFRYADLFPGGEWAAAERQSLASLLKTGPAEG